MSNELVQYSVSDVEKMAGAMAKSGMFGMKTPEQAMALMFISQAEGRHPALAAQDYHIIKVGDTVKPAKKAEAMMRDFLASGGKVEWHTLTDEKADATFSHPAGGTVRIDWDMPRAVKAGVLGNPTWKKFPRQMLRSRVVSEGVRSVCPAATSGMYEPEEQREIIEQSPPMKDVTPQPKDMVDELREKMKEAELVTARVVDALTPEDWESDINTAPNLEGLEHKFRAAIASTKDDTIRWRYIDAKELRKKELTKETP